MREWIIGKNRWSGELLSYRTKEHAAMECDMIRVIEADDANCAKDVWMELYSEGDIDNNEQ